MFKQSMENGFVNQEMVDFFTRQLHYLSNIAKKTHELTPELVSDQIIECVTLMEKRMVFILDKKTSE